MAQGPAANAEGPGGVMISRPQIPQSYGIVYFVRDESTGHIKVGYTERLRERLVGLKVESGSPVTLLAWTSGPRRAWRELERRFLALVGPTRIRGEWFLPSDLMHRCMQACSTDDPGAFIDQATPALQYAYRVYPPEVDAAAAPADAAAYWHEWAGVL